MMPPTTTVVTNGKLKELILFWIHLLFLLLFVIAFFRYVVASLDGGSGHIVSFELSPRRGCHLFTGKNPTYAQAIIKVFAHNTVYCVSSSSFLLFCAVQEKWKIKNITMVDFNNTALNDWLINTGIWIVEMNGGWCGWKSCQWLSFWYGIAFNRVTQ